jgi:hypothetical protein
MYCYSHFSIIGFMIPLSTGIYTYYDHSSLASDHISNPNELHSIFVCLWLRITDLYGRHLETNTSN